MNYQTNIGGEQRSYPIVTLGDGVRGVYFFLPGDVALIERCAELLTSRIPCESYDVIVTPEVGGLPLAHAMARLVSKNYLVLRKSIKPYMEDPITVQINSITTPSKQILVLDKRDVEKVQMKKVMLLDEVISTGGTIDGMFRILSNFQAQITQITAIFLEGDQNQETLSKKYECPVEYLGHLPLYVGDKVEN